MLKISQNFKTGPNDENGLNDEEIGSNTIANDIDQGGLRYQFELSNGISERR